MTKNWQLNKQVNISVLFQLACLASLIVGSWVNLQGQLDILQHDVTRLIKGNDRFYQKLERVAAKSIEHEYRLQAIEKKYSKANVRRENFGILREMGHE